MCGCPAIGAGIMTATSGCAAGTWSAGPVMPGCRIAGITAASAGTTSPATGREKVTRTDAATAITIAVAATALTPAATAAGTADSPRPLDGPERPACAGR